jgi:dihydropyrimidinase
LVSEYELIVRGGTVVTGLTQCRTDLCISEGRVAALTLDPRTRAGQVLDASGRLIFPGVIDSHVHMQIKQQDKYPTADDFESGSRAAAAGGVTTIIDFVEPESEGQSLWEAFRARRETADPQVVVDYGVHAVATSDVNLEAEIDRLIGSGVTSFKLFQVYGRLALSDAQLYDTLALVAARGAVATLHAENGQVADLLTGRLQAEGETAAIYHARSRPPFVEAACIQKAIDFAEAVGGTLYIVHLSTGEGLEAVRRAQARGLRVLAETCPQYLVLDESYLARPDGNLYLCTPPLRAAEHHDVLWKGMRQGSIQVAATDHCCFLRQQKLEARAFFQAPGGLGSIELLLPILHSEGVVKGRFGLSTLVRLLCHNPATIFGLAPRKGFLEPGSDADLVVFDPHTEWRVDAERLHGNDDYSVYEGMVLRGRVMTTISRGEVIYQDGEILAERGRGRFVPRGLPERAALRQILNS